MLQSGPLPQTEHPLRGLFAPRSIAIVGASDRSAWARAALRNLDKVGFDGDIHLVNRRGGEVLGRTAHTSCAAIGAPVDVAMLVIPAVGLLDALDDLKQAGISNAVILASGFGEIGEEGARLEAAIRDRANAHGINIIGPNCLGLANFSDRSALWTGSLRTPVRPGKVAIVSQSGAVAIAIHRFASQQGVGHGYLVSTGNELNTGVCDAIDYLLEDPGVEVIALFVEAIRDPAAFAKVARRAMELGKHIVALKVGRSEATALAAQAHTGALVGDDKVFDAFCSQYGILRAGSIDELVHTADLLCKARVGAEGDVAIISISGGLSEISADLAHEAGLPLAHFAPETAARLKEFLPDYATVHCPLDLTGLAVTEPDMAAKAIEAIADDPSVGVVVYVFDVPMDADDASPISLPMLRSVSEGVKRASAPVLVIANHAKGFTAETAAVVDELELPYLSGGLQFGLAALALARGQAGRVGALPEPAAQDSAKPLDGALPRTEYEAQTMLRGFDVPTIPAALAASRDEAVRMAAGIGGEVVLKISSPQIQHKTEVGGVAIGIAQDEVGDAFDAMMARVKAAKPDAVLDGVLISPMRKGGVELLVGITRDPQWGPTITVALGGVFVEIFKDLSLRLLPVSEAEVETMIGELRGAKLLNGYRGAPQADIPALARAICRIGEAALSLGDRIEALEVNPLVVDGDRIEALDALVIPAQTGETS